MLNVFIAASLQSIWNMINAQQLIVMMPLFDVVMPANAQFLFNQIMYIAAFNYVELDGPINKLLHLNHTEPLNQNFRKLGFESIYFLNNMGSMLIAFIIYPVLILVLLIMQKCTHNSHHVAKTYERLKRDLFYNSIVSMMTESYSMLSLCCLISFNKVSVRSFGEFIQSTISMFFFTMLFVYPFAITYTSVKNWKDISELRKHFGSYFEELRIALGPKILIFTNYLLFRRLLMAMVVVLTRKMLFLQVMVMAYSNIAQVILIGQLEVYETWTKKFVEFINEVLIMMVLYSVICFSSFVPDPEARFSMGYFCCVIVGLQLVFNIFFILSKMIWGAIFRIRI